MLKITFNKIRPSQILLLSFLLIIVAGTILLRLPFATQSGQNVDWLTAAFTSTSAVAVTGLSVVDISKVFSSFGQIVILVLIQLGGLGIMTFSSVIMILIGRKITYHEKRILQEDLNQDKLDGIVTFIERMIKIVFSIELIGALLLTIRFSQDMKFGKAVYFAVFHSVSAFCNAGFSLYSDSLVSYSDSIMINAVISALIIFGGIGFAVLSSFLLLIKEGRNEFNLTSKVAVKVSIYLLITGTILILISEYNNPNTLKELNTFEKILASFFQSVTTRTAGFNTISIGGLMPATKYLFLILMFVGASPGSAGGGVKTTTFGVIIYSVIAIIKNKKDVTIINRRISWHIINRAIALLAVSLLYLSISIFLILIIEQDNILDVIFEMVSAFGTVGLSTGITSSLKPGSQVIVIITMFIGRVGPLVVALALGENLKVAKYRYPRENILVG